MAVGEEHQLQTHLFEYNALTTRLTYWITLQYATYAIAVAALGFVAQAWGSNFNRVQLAWAVMLLMPLLAWAFLTTTYEMLTYVVYIERYLRPKLRPLMGTNSFWKFEQFLARLKRNPLIFLSNSSACSRSSGACGWRRSALSFGARNSRGTI